MSTMQMLNYIQIKIRKKNTKSVSIWLPGLIALMKE